MAGCLVLLASMVPVAAAEGSGGVAGVFQWRPFLAPFHSVVLHLPIGFMTIVFALEMLALKRPGEELRRVIGLVLVLSVWSGAITILLGLMRGDAGDYDAHTLSQHKIYGIAVGVMTILAWLFHKALAHGGKGAALWCYRLILVANLAVLVVAGHLGGNLTHGSDYLVKNAPEFVKEIIDEAEGAAPSKPAAGNGEDLFSKTIKPIFESKCYSCHGPEKKKGAYRMDDPEIAIKGGDSGETAITPGNPMKSNLVRLILLPEDDDDVMPPSGKGTLSNEETMAIIHWIRDGAKFPAGAQPAAPASAEAK